MLEIPETHTIARQLSDTVIGRTIVRVEANASPHGFAFFEGDPQGYSGLLCSKAIHGAQAVAGYIRLLAGDMQLLLHDGVNLRHIAPGAKLPAKHQLLLALDDGAHLVCTVQMYGGMYVYPEGDIHSTYYRVAVEKPSPLGEDFTPEYFEGIVRAAKPSLSVKALLATEQRIPGVGNGVLQDILYLSHLHPKRKVLSLGDAQKETLYHTLRQTLSAMTEQGGRDTERDLFGQSGGYRTLLSSKTLAYPCPACGGGITRQAYLGGNVYFCPVCQPL